MSSLREWLKSNAPLYLQNLPKYLVHIRYEVSKCQWVNIQLSQLCSNLSMVLLVFYEPSKLPSLSFFPSLTYSSTSALLDTRVILPISSHHMLSGALACALFSGEPAEASCSSFQEKLYQSLP